MKLPRKDWVQVGKSLYFCSGLACLSLAIVSKAAHGDAAFLLRLWVGGFGLLVLIRSLIEARS